MNRFKDLLLSVFVLGSIVIIIFIIISFFNAKTTIEISKNDNNEEKLLILRGKVDALEDGECKSFLKDYVKWIDDFNLEGTIKIRNLYFDMLENSPTTKYFEDAKNKCGFTNEEIHENNITSDYLTLLILPDVIFDKYLFDHELRLKDHLRSIAEANIDNVAYSTLNSTKLDILNKYINLLESREANYE